jgi:hypothetical protein
MNTSHNRVSILRCEPHTIDNSHCDEINYGLGYPFPVTVWRVFVDDKCVAQQALPFASGDEVIELSVDPCVPFLGEGSDFVLARQSGHKIMWFRAAKYNWESAWIQDLWQVDQIYYFDAAQYLMAVPEVGQVRDEATLPPYLTTEEMRTCLKKLFPRDLDLPLYRIPAREGDTRGEKLFRHVWNVISSGELRISDAPEKVAEIHIGFDTREFREAVWQVGRVGDEVAILFLAEPYFPIWVSGFKGAFQAEAALLAGQI